MDNNLEEIERYGKIVVIDSFGIFEQYKEVSYDIMGFDDNTVYRHIPESDIERFSDLKVE